MLLQMYMVDTMTSLLKMQLEYEIERFEKALKTGRRDGIALYVLGRMQDDINRLARRIEDEEKSRKEIVTCTSACGFTRCIRKIMHRYWSKCYGNHYAIPTIPAIETL